MTATADGEAGPLHVAHVTRVTNDEATEIAALAAAATTADGAGPLDDQVRTELAFGAGPASQHVIARRDAPPVIGYAHVALDDEGASGHLVVHPDHRRRGVGGRLVDDLLALVSTHPDQAADQRPAEQHRDQPRTLRVWAHGDTAGARALAAARGFTRARQLWQMRRPLEVALPAPTYPADVTVRTFEPGRDDDGWVALNAAAFATHPEQGRLTVDDLRHRIAQPWFHPGGFFLAERAGVLVGSHWTKVHPPEETGGDPVGEVYAVGVHPSAQGVGLGKALTLTGLRHLRDEGLREVILYVDGDNAAAIGLYKRLGFVTVAVDVMYASG